MLIEERITKYLNVCDVAVSGEHGHSTTLRVAIALVHGFDISPEEALPFFETWNQGCMPPWNERDLMRKLRQADQLTPRSGKPRGYLLD